MRKIKQLCLLATLFVALTACVQTQRITSESYEIDTFSEIHSNIIGDIIFEESATPYFKVSGSSDMIDKLVWNVKDGVLYLEYENPRKFNLGFFKSKRELHIRLAAPKLSHIINSGVGKITLKGEISNRNLTIESEGVGAINATNLSCGRIDVISSGVGNITLGGNADSFMVSSEGVGNIKADALTAKNVTVRSEGVGNISCYASESIDIKSEGVGNVKYYGNPSSKNIETDGVGHVKAAE